MLKDYITLINYDAKKFFIGTFSYSLVSEADCTALGTGVTCGSGMIYAQDLLFISTTVGSKDLRLTSWLTSHRCRDDESDSHNRCRWHNTSTR